MFTVMRDAARMCSAVLALFFAIAAAITTTSCVKGKEQVCPEDINKKVIFSPMADSRTGTRAASGHPINNGEMIPVNSLFGVYAWQDVSGTVTNFAALQNMDVKRTGTGSDNYEYDPLAFWPMQVGAQMNFFAYYPWTDQTVSTPNPQITPGIDSDQSLKIEYTVSPNSDEHIDLMYARTGMISGYDPVGMEFNHALARLKFEGNIEHFPSGTDVRITGIKIKNSILKGTLDVKDPVAYPNKPEWDLNPAHKGDITMPSSHLRDIPLTTSLQRIILSTANGEGANGDILPLPQSVEGLELEVTTTRNGETFISSFPLYGNDKPDWEMNKITTYEITITPYGINFTVKVIDWEKGYTIPLPLTLEITHDEYWFAYDEGSGNRLEVGVTTNQPEWKVSAIRVMGNDDFYMTAEDDKLIIYPNSTNSALTPRVCIVTVTDGNEVIKKTITLVQGIPANVGGAEQLQNTYVGAFWKANQTGERVIRINHTGEWSATIGWYNDEWAYGSDGIVLLPGGSYDPGIYSTNPGIAENYKIDKGTIYVSGTGEILFRIGLQQSFGNYSNTPNYQTTFPARYALVMITHSGGKVQKLFIRQGEGADYVMRDTDLVNGGTRPLAKRWSPYNIKEGAHRIPTMTNNVYFSLTSRGVWVDYPTMVGYFFPFNQSYFGYPPINNSPQVQPVTQNWNGQQGFWSNNAPETCPSSYRRPNDGPTNVVSTGAVSASEFRQSLWLNPQSGTSSASNVDNSVGGFYADGYYDRGVIDMTGLSLTSGGKYSVYYYNNQFFTPAPTAPNGSLPAEPNRVFTATSGLLFYNPATNASLFFPAGGESDVTNGLILTKIGEAGGYWTSTRVTTGNQTGTGSVFRFNILGNGNISSIPTTVNMGSAMGANFFPIRCVVQ